MPRSDKDDVTGKADVLVWNVEHKTEFAGGEKGYPDPEYLDRVGEQLRQLGIFEAEDTDV